MAEELKELIAKIQEEGVRAAQDKAAAIEDEARRRADEKIRNAEAEAERIVADARDKAIRTEESAKTSIKQASRDMLIALKKGVAAMLDKLVTSHVHRALSVEELAAMLVVMIKGCGGPAKDRIIISLKKDDLEKVERTLFAELGAEAKKGITLKSAADIHGGFTISYDSGKSYFDFTEKALAEYLASHMNPQLAELLKEATAKEGK
jgi:V/A-type H+/Na+-transporting ATPase subunit E